MATTFSAWDTTPAQVVGDFKQRILASSDWQHLQVGASNTTLSTAAATGATGVSTVAIVATGACITVWKSPSLNGAATPESRISTGYSGAGPYLNTFTTPLAKSYATGDAVGVGSIVKATTTRGAQMVVDLADTAATAVKMNLAVYRTHDGTTGVDKLTRYLNVRASGGALTDYWHCRLSAGKEHIYLDAEGPRPGELNPVAAAAGSYRQCMFLGDLVPYFDTDTVPVVVLLANSTSAAVNSDKVVWVSRNQANTMSWVTARIATLCAPAAVSASSAPLYSTTGFQRVAAGDGKTYVFPYVIFEDTDGLRGRLNKCFFAGFNFGAYNGAGDIIPGNLSKITYGGDTYILIAPDHSDSSATISSSFGRHYNDSAESPVIAVPYA